MGIPYIVMLLVGIPRSMGTEGATDPMDRPWRSGIYKEPVVGPVWLGKTNLTGDGQADLKHHGGPDKAVLVYPAAHYNAWQRELGRPDLTYGGLGENFTVENQDETTVCIGDTYRVGEALVQVSQPRQPCWKPARRWRVKDLAFRMQVEGRTGWYFRVLKEGHVQEGDHLVLEERPFPQWTIARANEIMHRGRGEKDASAALAACPLLSASWVRTLSRRVSAGIEPNVYSRLIGPNADDIHRDIQAPPW